MSGYGSYLRRRRTPRRGERPSTFFYRLRDWKRARAERKKEAPSAVVETAFAFVGEHENLLQIFHDLKHRAGQAPGPDGLTYNDLGPREAAALMRSLARTVRDGSYRPSTCRKVRIPKASGKGFRELRVRNLCDRVVSAALYEALNPLWEQVFLPRSHGFRPQRNVLRLLAELEHTMVTQDRWVLAIDDVRNAFDNVTIDDLMNDHRRHIRDGDLLSLLERVLRGEDKERKVGIDQGAAYSPTALNIRLHYAHDLILEQNSQTPPWYRYADNLVYPCRNTQEGQQTLEKVQQLLREHGFDLKREELPIDLRMGDKAQLLGFTLSYKDGQVEYDLGKDTWRNLAQQLEKAHETPNPTETARMVVMGWINSYGPAYPHAIENGVIEQILNLIDVYGFQESITPPEIHQQWEKAWQRWQLIRKELHQPHANDHPTVPQTPSAFVTSPTVTVQPAASVRPRPECLWPVPGHSGSSISEFMKIQAEVRDSRCCAESRWMGSGSFRKSSGSCQGAGSLIPRGRARPPPPDQEEAIPKDRLPSSVPHRGPTQKYLPSSRSPTGRAVPRRAPARSFSEGCGQLVAVTRRPPTWRAQLLAY